MEPTTAAHQKAPRRAWILREGESGTERRIGPCTLKRAKARAHEWAREGEWGDDYPIWVDTQIYSLDGEHVSDVETVIEEPEPRCDDQDRRKTHAWGKESTRGHGGGVITRRTCSECGIVEVYDSWAQRPDNGVQGYSVTTYERPE